ncbi:hypothetical protein HT031_003529 [Scenedesmus sp. PABB004]|nr:hypothetical protein HT031_003529 [Scenedesmus sp. PABB004]
MECVAAIDQGTQSTRVFIFDAKAKPVASHQEQFKQIYPRAGWCEHDPLVIWESVQRCIDAAVAAAEAKAGPVKVVALGITNQRETTVVWSRATGRPLHNAIVWLDNRTSDICRAWEAALPGGKDHFRPVTGLPVSTYFSAYKLQWLRENVPEVAAAVLSGDAMFGTVDSWLIYCLTGGPHGGVHVTDVTNASRTNLMDLATLSWHGPALELFGAPLGIMPRIASNAEVYGAVAAGRLAGVPIAGCLGDQMAALLGQRAAPGEAKNTYGTGCFMLLNTGGALTPSRHGLLTTVAHRLGPGVPPSYALEGSVAVAGLGISWLRDNLRIIDSADDSEAIAAGVPDTGGVYFVPAFSGLLAPHWQEDARGALLGMTAFTTRGHVVRALLEAICFQSREVLQAMLLDTQDHQARTLSRGLSGALADEAAAAAAEAGGTAPAGDVQGAVAPSGGGGGQDFSASLNLLRVDGGATHNDLLMQLQSDILQVPVQRPHFQETTALGAALAAGLTVGLWDEAFVRAHPEGASRTFTPSVSREEADRRFGHWQKAVSRCLDLADLAL